jgi:hypothetical protein
MCRDLTGLRSRSLAYGPIYFGEAVHLVVHESSHLTGIWDEYQAESRTQQVIPAIMRHIVRLLDPGRYDFRYFYRNAMYGSQAWHRALPRCYREDVSC